MEADNRGGSVSLRVLLENVRRSGGLMEERQRRVVVDTMSGEYHRRRRMPKGRRLALVEKPQRQREVDLSRCGQRDCRKVQSLQQGSWDLISPLMH